MNAFETNFKVGTKVKVYNPYGSFEYEDVVKSITPKGKYIKIGSKNYRAISKNEALAKLSRWGQGSIRII